MRCHCQRGHSIGAICVWLHGAHGRQPIPHRAEEGAQEEVTASLLFRGMNYLQHNNQGSPTGLLPVLPVAACLLWLCSVQRAACIAEWA